MFDTILRCVDKESSNLHWYCGLTSPVIGFKVGLALGVCSIDGPRWIPNWHLGLHSGKELPDSNATLQQGRKDDGTCDGAGLVDFLEKDGVAHVDSVCVDTAELVLVTDLKALCGDGD